MNRSRQKIQPHWWHKSLAGALLGLTLSYGLIAIFAWYGPGGIQAANKVQVNMWLISPIWLLILSFVYLFHTGRQAWTVLTIANLIVFALFIGMRMWV